MRLPCALPLFLSLAACWGGDTLRADGAADKVWHLKELRNTPVEAKITLTFPDPGKIAGTAPCNQYFATQEVAYPRFKAGPIAATKRACPALTLERAYFTALEGATLSEELGDTLILSNDEGVLLVFKATE